MNCFIFEVCLMYCRNWLISKLCFSIINMHLLTIFFFFFSLSKLDKSYFFNLHISKLEVFHSEVIILFFIDYLLFFYHIPLAH